VFENRVLREIFGSKRDEVTGEWRKLLNGELHNLYSSPYITRQIKWRKIWWAGRVARMGEESVGGFDGNAWRKETTRRPRCRWNGITMDLRKICLGFWSGFTWFRIGIAGGLLWTRWWNFGFCRHKISYLYVHTHTHTHTLHSELFWRAPDSDGSMTLHPPPAPWTRTLTQWLRSQETTQ
jgi:hypothetical protein